MKYLVICNSSVFELQNIVNRMLASNYKPLGGVAIMKVQYGLEYCQALIGG